MRELLIGWLAALALARAGDLAKAKKVADSLNEEFPVDTKSGSYRVVARI
jgi:hypothetical protein